MNNKIGFTMRVSKHLGKYTSTTGGLLVVTLRENRKHDANDQIIETTKELVLEFQWPSQATREPVVIALTKAQSEELYRSIASIEHFYSTYFRSVPIDSEIRQEAVPSAGITAVLGKLAGDTTRDILEVDTHGGIRFEFKDEHGLGELGDKANGYMR